MGGIVEIRVLELLAARLCHELISPVGAIANGVELLGEDDPDFVRDAIKLIGDSAKKAGQRLQFYRFAYGASSGAAAVQNPRELTLGLFEGGKTACEWGLADAALPTELQKLACNMILIAAEALPRGGRVELAGLGGGAGLRVAASGETVALPAEARAALRRETPVGELTSRTVQGYFTALLAGEAGLAVAIEEEGTRFVLAAKPA